MSFYTALELSVAIPLLLAQLYLLYRILFAGDEK